MKTLSRLWNAQRDVIISATLFLLAFALYVRTLAPTVVFLFDDTLEFQYVIPRLGILHPTGYPLYALLGKLFTLIVPLNDVAYRLNLFSALCAALAVAFVYLVAQQLTTHRIAAIMGATIFAVGEHILGTSRRRRSVRVADDFRRADSLAHTALRVAPYPSISLHARVCDGARADTSSPHRSPLPGHCDLPIAYQPANSTRTTNTYPRRVLFPIATYHFTLLASARQPWLRRWHIRKHACRFCVVGDGVPYTAFLTQNPFQVQHDAEFFATMFRDQFTLAGLVLAAGGLLWLLRKPKEWALLVIALIAELIFAFNYRTADVDVHLLTPFLLLAIFVAGGADAIIDFLKTRFAGVAPALGGLLFTHPDVFARYPFRCE